MQIKNGKDFWAGLMFLAVGLGFMTVAMKNYNMGTAVRMGPAYFPVMLGGLQALLGAIVLFRSFAIGDSPGLKVFPFRPWLIVASLLVGYCTYLVKGQSTLLFDIGLGISYILFQCAFGGPALYVVLAAVVIFALILKPLGLLFSAAVLTIVARAGGADFRWADQPKSITFGLLMYGLFALMMAALSDAIGKGKAGAVSLVVIVAVSIFLGRKIKGIEIGALFAVLGVFCVVIFGHGLGLPFNACPEIMDEACRKIGLGS